MGTPGVPKSKGNLAKKFTGSKAQWKQFLNAKKMYDRLHATNMGKWEALEQVKFSYKMTQSLSRIGRQMIYVSNIMFFEN